MIGWGFEPLRLCWNTGYQGLPDGWPDMGIGVRYIGRPRLHLRVGQVWSGLQGRAGVVRVHVLRVGGGCIGEVGSLAILVRQLGNAACS